MFLPLRFYCHSSTRHINNKELNSIELNYAYYIIYIIIFRSIKSSEDCLLLQSNIKFLQGWCTANCMKLNISNSRVISFFKKTNVVFDYKLCQSSILHRIIDAKLHFHNNVNHIFPHCFKLSGPVRFITHNFPSLEYVLTLYTTLV
jgi:hypothetical protein